MNEVHDTVDICPSDSVLDIQFHNDCKSSEKGTHTVEGIEMNASKEIPKDVEKKRKNLSGSAKKKRRKARLEAAKRLACSDNDQSVSSSGVYSQLGCFDKPLPQFGVSGGKWQSFDSTVQGLGVGISPGSSSGVNRQNFGSAFQGQGVRRIPGSSTCGMREECSVAFQSAHEPIGSGRNPVAIGFTSPGIELESKKNKPTGGKTRSWHATNNKFEVAVCREGVYDSFSSEQKLEFSSAIGEAIFNLPEDSDIPRFKSTRSRFQYLIVSAVDQYSMDWLIKSVPSFKLSGSVLKAFPATNIPKLKKAMIWLPGKLNNATRALRLLNMQNKGLDCLKWKIREEKHEKHGLRLVVAMEEYSFKFLERIKFSPFYGSGIAKVVVLGPSGQAKHTTSSVNKYVESDNQPAYRREPKVWENEVHTSFVNNYVDSDNQPTYQRREPNVWENEVHTTSVNKYNESDYQPTYQRRESGVWENEVWYRRAGGQGNVSSSESRVVPLHASQETDVYFTTRMQNTYSSVWY